MFFFSSNTKLLECFTNENIILSGSFSGFSRRRRRRRFRRRRRRRRFR
jgi:hypothetical protein